MLHVSYPAGGVLLTLPALFCLAQPLRAEVDSLAFPLQQIEQVEVCATRQSGGDRVLRSSTQTHIERAKIERTHHPSLLPLLTEQVPGLFITSRGVMGYGVSGGAAGGISMRGVGGSPTTGVLVVIDGEPQYMGLMGHPLADSYLSSGVERVEVVRGPASVRYGSNAMGGVIHISTQEAKHEGIHGHFRGGYGSWNTLQSDVRLALCTGPVRASVGGSYSRSDGHRPNMQFEQHGARFNLSVDLGRGWRLGGSAEMVASVSSNPGSIVAPLYDNDADVVRSRAALQLSHRSARLSGGLNLFYNWGRHKINDGYKEGESPQMVRFHSRDKLWGVTLHEEFSLSQSSSLSAGVELFRFGGRAWNRSVVEGTDDLLADKEEGEVAAFLHLRQQLFRWLIFDAGLRYDHHSRIGGEWVPRVGLTLPLCRGGELRGSVAKGFRFPTIREMYLFPAQNPNLKPERVINYELSWQQTLRQGRLRYALTLFYLEGDNMIQTLLVDGRPRNENSGEIRNWGLEGELNLTLCTMVELEAHYSYLDMRYPVLAAPTHKLHLGLHLQWGIWSLSSALEYIDGLYTQLPSAGGALCMQRYWDWRLRSTLRLARWATLWLRAENLLNQRYEINAGFPMPGRTFMGGVELNF